MARKTFATMGDRYFKFPWRALMDVTHHKSMKQFSEQKQNILTVLEETHVYLGQLNTV